jgi:hypothetical protein
VSEQMAEQTSGESGSVGAGPAVPPSSEAQNKPVAAAAPESLESMQESTSVEAPKLPDADAPNAEVAKADVPKTDAPRTPGKIMIMSAGDRTWEGNGAGPEPQSEPNSPMFGKRRLAALAAIVALATLTGALGGALATAGLTYFAGDGATASANSALDATVARIDADILALKASVERTSKLGMSQFSKTSDRLDKVEKAQAEPAAKLAKLSEAVDKLRAAPAVAPVPVAAASAAAKEVTGSISPPVTAPAAAPKVEVARLPTVEGWVLRDVGHGGALIEGRQGIFEVYAGDPVPGLGKVDAIRRQDGRWVVVTSRGLIVAR